MSWGGPGFVIAIIAIVSLASVVKYWIRSANAATAGRDGAAGDRDGERLAGENEDLRRQVSRLEERLRVLERIATDPAERTAREINDLR